MNDSAIRVLLVDDEEEFVLFLSQRLRSHGLSVMGTMSCNEALGLASNRTFDVAVVDLKMPGPGGLEALEGLKKLQPMLEVIMLTGHGTFGAALESGRLSALQFLEKPCDFEIFLEEVKNAYKRKRRAQSSAYQQELNDLVSERLSPRDILAKTERLQKKYEQ